MKGKGIVCAVLAAFLYALSTPCSKVLLDVLPVTMLAGLLYLGAGIGLFFMCGFQRYRGKSNERHLTKNDIPYTVGMVVLDILAPICLIYGLSTSSSASVSLLNNFEIVATAMIALFIFKEQISKRLWIAIALVTTASVILTLDGIDTLDFSYGSLFVLLACVCWGLENNCTRKLSDKNPMEIVVIKGLGSGTGSVIIALVIGERLEVSVYIIFALLLGFVAYGLSIYFYIYAQRFLGAARTSTYYALAPFIGVALSLLFFRELPSVYFWAALVIMAVGIWFQVDS
ncbi:MAG TPA: DMT family transporter [Lachnospiraceae bacterium]|nr:DMT family transporter [Lachnospiraceae bacterium]